MNFNTDKPIEFAGEDLLGRASFAENLGKAIYECDAKDGFVIGIYGEWGSGKTSIINMAIQTVNEMCNDESNRPIIIKFSPWNYSEQSNLISIFFSSLQNQIATKGDDEFKRKVGKALSNYAGAFDALSVIPVLGSGVAAIFKTVATAKGNDLIQGVDLDKARMDLEDCLIKSDRRVIVVIDDIDRLTNIQIRDIFQLVKQVADFPNIIYLLAMDRKIICRALKEVHNVEGNEYLEKIIQVSFEIPILQKRQVNSMLLDEIIKIAMDGNHDRKRDIFYLRSFDGVLKKCVEPYIETPRDINRVINIFRFRYNCLYDVTCFEDLLAISTLEIMEPELYKWISKNKDGLCRKIVNYNFTEGFGIYKHKNFLEDKNTLLRSREKYVQEFRNIGVGAERAISCIATLFPAVAKDIGENEYQDDNSFYLNRLADFDCFDNYFSFDLDNPRTPAESLYNCAFVYDYRSISRTIDIAVKYNMEIEFLNEIIRYLDAIPYNRIKIIVIQLFELLDKRSEVIGEKASKFMRIRIENLVIERIYRASNDVNKYELACFALDKFSADGMRAIIYWLKHYEITESLLGHGEQTILERIKIEYADKIEGL